MQTLRTMLAAVALVLTGHVFACNSVDSAATDGDALPVSGHPGDGDGPGRDGGAEGPPSDIPEMRSADADAGAPTALPTFGIAARSGNGDAGSSGSRGMATRDAGTEVRSAPDYDGSWEGITEEGWEITFEVQGGGVSRMTYAYAVGGCVGIPVVGFFPPHMIRDSRVSIDNPGPSGLAFEATFSGAEAEGTIEVTEKPFGPFDSTIPICEFEWRSTWTAQRQ
jgi:hypothetical protein